MHFLSRLGLTSVVALAASSACLYNSDDTDVFLDTDGGDPVVVSTGTTGIVDDTFGTAGDPDDPDSCEPHLQNTCGPDHKCTVAYDLVTDSDAKCVPITGTDEIGQPCETGAPSEGLDSCVDGSVCLTNFTNAFPSGQQCVAFCEREGACDPPGTECINAFGIELPVCLQLCDPLDTSSCEDPWVCHEDPGNARWYCAPRLDGTDGQHGADCVPNALGLCAPGYVCMQNFAVDSPDCLDATSDQGCCAALCELGDEQSCPSELERCHPLYDAPPPAFENVGVCVVLQSDP